MLATISSLIFAQSAPLPDFIVYAPTQSVPDGSASGLLLGMAIIATGIFVRYFGKK